MPNKYLHFLSLIFNIALESSVKGLKEHKMKLVMPFVYTPWPDENTDSCV